MPTGSDLRNIFCINLNRLMRENGTSQKELSDYMSVSPTSINNWVKGYKIPRMDKIDLLCKYFKVRRADLLENESSVNTHTKKDRDDLSKVLDRTEIMFDGETDHLDEEGQQKLRNALEFVFWDAKKQNKRKKD